MAPDILADGLRSASQPAGSIETTPEKWLIQKFGGTSIGKGPISIVDNVVRRVYFLKVSAIRSNRRFDCCTDRDFRMAELQLSAPHEVAAPKRMEPPTGQVHRFFCFCYA